MEGNCFMVGTLVLEKGSEEVIDGVALLEDDGSDDEDEDE
jgi:hypothetical protein